MSDVEIILEGPDGVMIEQSLQFEFQASNNQAGYEALLVGMKLARELRLQVSTAKSDSQLATSQVSREYQVENSQLMKYWDRVQKRDCTYYIRRCNKCQWFADIHRAPPKQSHLITSSWPFYVWGVDILGSFPPATNQVKFLIVAVNYFTKWVEVESMAMITMEKIKKFYWKKLICHFGLPSIIILDNDTQFMTWLVVKFCSQLGIKQSFTSVEHPQINRQVELANKVVLKDLKKRLEEAKGLWAEELAQVLWSYHTTPDLTTQETPFRLTFDTNTMIPIEIEKPYSRAIFFQPAQNEEEKRANLDLLQEVREVAYIKEYVAKAMTSRRYNTKLLKYKGILSPFLTMKLKTYERWSPKVTLGQN
ncbi:Gypsy retrotransposon integrase-like protein 1, partial [Mucuna pruriens]